MPKLPTILLAVVCCVTCCSDAEAEDDKTSYYLIGNSLTWDTIPSRLDGDVQWHVDCGKSLQFIHDHPEMPCVKQSTLWPQALKEKQYDLVSVQPHYGTSLAQDVAVISHWVELQPDAVFVIHTGWAHHAERAREYAIGDVPEKMQHCRAYIAALLEELQKKYPQREFRQTHAMDLLARIADDVSTGKAPLKAVEDLHRDKIHMDLVTGRYLMHNAMRHALGQPRSASGFEKLDPEMKTYLDGVLARLAK